MAELVALEKVNGGVNIHAEQNETDYVAICLNPIVEAEVEHDHAGRKKKPKIYHTSKEVREWMDLMNEVWKKTISKDLLVSQLKDTDIKVSSQFEKYCADTLYFCRILAHKLECDLSEDICKHYPWQEDVKIYDTLSVKVNKSIEPVFLDTTLMGMLYGPITFYPERKPSNNLSTLWKFTKISSTEGFTLENLVTPGAVLTFMKNGDIFDIVFQKQTGTANHVVYRKIKKGMMSLFTKVNGIEFFIVPKTDITPPPSPPRGHSFVANSKVKEKNSFLWHMRGFRTEVVIDDDDFDTCV